MKTKRQTVTTLDTEYKYEAISHGRRRGNTTRLIDRAIQIIFNGDVCLVQDHHEHGENRLANEFLFDKIVARIKNEHPYILQEGLLNIEKNRLKIYLIPEVSADKPIITRKEFYDKYCKLSTSTTGGEAYILSDTERQCIAIFDMAEELNIPACIPYFKDGITTFAVHPEIIRRLNLK